MERQKYRMVLRDQQIDMLRVLEVQDDILALMTGKLNLPKLQELPRCNDDSYLAIAGVVGVLAELAFRVEERDLGALIIEVDQVWKEAVKGLPCR
jgi:hypothetical protein